MRVHGTANKQSQFLAENLVFNQFVVAAIGNNAKRKKYVKRIRKVLNWCILVNTQIQLRSTSTRQKFVHLSDLGMQIIFKNLFMLSVRISSYGCTWEVQRARKIRKSSSRRGRQQFQIFERPPNFLSASITRYTHS